MPRFQKLKAPEGTDEANAAGVKYRVDNDGTIDVPEEAVAPLLKCGGFVAVPDPQDVPVAGFVLVKHASADGVSWNGQNFEAGANGMIAVPSAAVCDLVAHGFLAVSTVE